MDNQGQRLMGSGKKRHREHTDQPGEEPEALEPTAPEGEDSTWQEEWGDTEQANFMLSLPSLAPYPDEDNSVEDATVRLDEEFGEENDLQEESTSLETLFEDIEEIVHHLETEEVSLEESLRLFEQGIRFCREATRRLDEAEGVIERLLRDPETGEDEIVPWQEGSSKST